MFVTVRGEIDEATSYFINFSPDLKAIIKDKVEGHGPQNLNLDVPWMQGKQTSSRFGHRNLGTLEPIIRENGCLER